MRSLLLFFLAASTFAQEAPVGIVTMVQGDAKLMAPGAKAAATVEIADVLQAGSRITTASGKVSFVSCAQSVGAQIQPESEVIFSMTGYEARKGSVTQAHKVPPCRVPVNNIGGPNAHIGGVNMRGGEATMVLLSPVGTRVDPTHIVFRWKAVAEATNYRVALSDGKGSDVWESETKSAKTELAYGGAERLTPGSVYRWRVTALQGEEVLSSASAKLDTFSADDLARIASLKKQGDGAESHLMLGMLYEELNAPDLALGEYGKVSAHSKSKWLEEKIAALKRPLTP